MVTKIDSYIETQRKTQLETQRKTRLETEGEFIEPKAVILYFGELTVYCIVYIRLNLL